MRAKIEVLNVRRDMRAAGFSMQSLFKAGSLLFQVIDRDGVRVFVGTCWECECWLIGVRYGRAHRPA